jgi:hypothetical protein
LTTGSDDIGSAISDDLKQSNHTVELSVHGVVSREVSRSIHGISQQQDHSCILWYPRKLFVMKTPSWNICAAHHLSSIINMAAVVDLYHSINAAMATLELSLSLTDSVTKRMLGNIDRIILIYAS